MPEDEFEKLEQALLRAGKAVHYPPTPALAPRVLAALEQAPTTRQNWLPRRALVALAALVVALGLLLAFPATRQALAQFLGLPSVRIIPVTPTSPPSPPPTREGGRGGVGQVTATALPLSTPTATGSATAQCCQTTLADAQARAGFKLLLPPSEPPSRVYMQELPDFGGAQQIILVFGDPSAPRFTLYEATGFIYGKMVSGGTVIQETTVKGERALWLSGAPHALVYLDAKGNPQLKSERVVDANTLAWEIGNVTYRLETHLSEDETIRFAESLR